jgi:uncharacterized protein (DUF488 family)
MSGRDDRRMDSSFGLNVFTIGFTQKPAERFFGLLREARVERVLDVRLHTQSQLAGFAKRDDLRFFLATIAGIDYLHLPDLAPTQQLLHAYRERQLSWDDYARAYRALLVERDVLPKLSRTLVEGGCFLCSEHLPDRCHRRLLVEHLAEQWPDVRVTHLA